MIYTTEIRTILEKLGITEPILPTRRNILRVLDEKGLVKICQIVKALKTPRTTIYDNLKRLKQKGYVEDILGDKPNPGEPGRPPKLWRIVNKNEISSDGSLDHN